MTRTHRLLGLLWLLLLVPMQATAQEATPSVVELNVYSADTNAFPDISLEMTAQDSDGNGVRDFSALTLTEADVPVSDFTVETVPTGLDVTFVIDANRDITWVDLIGDVPRLAKVRTSIAQFANRTLNRAGTDRVHIVVPDGDEPTFLLSGASTPSAVTDAIGSYTPSTFSARSPVNAMLEAALTQTPPADGNSRYRAVVLYTDAVDLAEQLDYDQLLPLAAQSDATFYVVILGKRADADEVDAASALFAPTGGRFVHMPEPEAAQTIYDTLQSHSNRFRVTYRSTLAESGTQRIVAAMGDVSAALDVPVTILPPTVTIDMPNEPIFRLRDDMDLPLESAEPTRTLISAQVTWPDEHPRTLTTTKLLVNGTEQPLRRNAILDVTGRLTLEWDMSDADAGRYELVIELVDELGLVARSAPFVQEIETEIAVTPTTAPTVEPTITPSPLEETVALVEPFVTPRNIQYGLGGLAALLLLVVVWRWRRRATRGPAEIDAVPAVAATPLPPLSDQFPKGAHLLVAEHGSTPAQRIDIDRETLTIGSAAGQVDAVLAHSSVAPLHARLRFRNGVFLLYDEGSTSGTLVNRERLALAPQILQHGDEIVFGRIRAELRLDPTTPDDTP